MLSPAGLGALSGGKLDIKAKAAAYDWICERDLHFIRAVGGDKHAEPEPEAVELTTHVRKFIKNLPLGAEVTVRYERNYPRYGQYIITLTLPVRGPERLSISEAISEAALEAINDAGYLQHCVRSLFNQAFRSFA